MNIKSYPFLYFMILFVFATACKDDEDTEPVVDTTAPVINVISPEDGSNLQPGTITVIGTVEEEGELEQIVITGVINTMFGPFQESTTINKEDLPAKNGNLYTLSQEYEIPSGVTGTVKVTIVAIDAEGNEGEKEVTYTISE